MPMHTTNPQADTHTITSLTQLEALFGAVGDASLKKEVDYLHPAYQALIKASPFAVLATAGPGGLDASPRGDPPGFVAIQDDKTLLLPERRGNNRIDSLRNLLVDPRMALLFLVPGAGETLRVNGRASITTEPGLLQRFAMEGKPPLCVIVIKVESVFFQCARAIQRSRLWQAVPQGRPDVPTPGAMLQALTAAAIDGEKYDRELPARQKSTLY
jgi:PPOX class probable FMN-dependent enzyme